MAKRYNILRLNYSAVEFEKEALQLKVEELSANSVSDKALLAELNDNLKLKRLKMLNYLKLGINGKLMQPAFAIGMKLLRVSLTPLSRRRC